MQSTNVEAWTSAVEADVFQNGQVISKRMDVLLGSSLGSCKGDMQKRDTVLSMYVTCDLRAIPKPCVQLGSTRQPVVCHSPCSKKSLTSKMCTGYVTAHPAAA